ncbi:MAG: hypothetical protein QHH13_05830 [Melioribacter sp.]|uniref:hypothetical protein n=1 Tax=Rosettibacter primus TaxID=3111523 RepID=UPI00247B8FA0|nr:hypothetical protein [Melioribacter sp.]
MFLFYLIGYLILFFIIMGFMIKYAPLGYEDENGFHYVYEKSNKSKFSKSKVA